MARRVPLRLRTALLALAGALAALAAPAGASASPHPPVFSFDSVQRYGSRAGYIAHEFGSIDGYAYSNTLEAFNRSYAEGFRLFECDLVRLADGTVLLAHDRTERLYGLKKSFHDATLADVRHLRYRGRYTLLTSHSLIHLMRSHPDVRVILDTKWEHLEILREIVHEAQGDRSVLDRLVPHVTNPANIRAVRSIYHFRGAILALYRMGDVSNSQIVKTVRTFNLSAVMMISKDRHGLPPREFSPQLYSLLSRLRIPTFVFAVGRPYLVARFRALGVGVYSDGWFFSGPRAAAAASARDKGLVYPPGMSALDDGDG